MAGPCRTLIGALSLAVALALPRLATAAPVAVTGSFELFFNLFPPPVFTFQGTVDVSGGTLTIPAGLVSETGAFFPIHSNPPLVTGIVVTVANGAGQFSVGGAGELCPGPLVSGRGACVVGGGLGGSMPLQGVSQVQGPIGINVPLSVIGQDGELVSGSPVLVQGAAWTTRTARVTLAMETAGMLTMTGSATGPLGVTGSTVTLVTPFHIDVSGFAVVPGFSRMSITFVPEPGPIVLVATGLAGLALTARSHRRGEPAPRAASIDSAS